MKYFYTCIMLCAIYSITLANNIKVKNITLTGQDLDNKFTLVEFDLSWENSWRTPVGPSNHDAAWVFIKFRKNGAWEHATLNYLDGSGTGDGHTVPSGSTINTASDQVGCFVYQSSVGTGNVNFLDVQLRWNYGVDGVLDTDIVDVQVFAIEMVYIPLGSFYVGAVEGGPEVDNFYSPDASGMQLPYFINSENEIVVKNAIGNLYYDVVSSSNFGDQVGPVPAAFPKGFNAFYIMKYEVSEDQWVSFFNSLNAIQKPNLDITGGGVGHKNSDGVLFRNTVAWTAGGIATTAAPSRAVSYVTGDDMIAYLDWTGLRPMTELEFEKACRGPNTPFPAEYAWGTDNIYSTTYSITDDGTQNAIVTNPGTGGLGNCNYLATSPGGGGPMRVGIFAASAIIKNRVETGATYYGVMEMSGNLWEACISVGASSNRTFTGLHGDGELNTNGFANVSNWVVPYCIRGGSYPLTGPPLMVGDRAASAFSGATAPPETGIRGARTAE